MGPREMPGGGIELWVELTCLSERHFSWLKDRECDPGDRLGVPDTSSCPAAILLSFLFDRMGTVP